MRAILRFAAAAFVLVAGAAMAQDYPSRTVRLIVPVGPGGGTDILARHVAQKLGERLKQSVIVENRPGAGSLVGTEHVAKAPPDGYTVLVGGIFNMVMNRALLKTLPYDPLRDFVPLCYISAYPFVLVSRTDLPASNLRELVQHAKERPGKLTYGWRASARCSMSGARFSSRAWAWTWCTSRSRPRRRRTRKCLPAGST